MKIIEMPIDEPLLLEVDQVIKSLNISRSVFIHQALQLALNHYKLIEMEKKHAEGYARHPIQAGEFDIWEDEQVWGEA